MSYSRRHVLKTGAAIAGSVLLPRVSFASPSEVEDEIRALFGNRPVIEDKVTVKIPALSENGFSVPMTVDVDSPMTESDYVVRIAVFAEENPLPNVGRFELGPDAGVARIQTRIRMGGSQRIRAVAEMSDGQLFGGHAFSVVTLAACVV